MGRTKLFIPSSGDIEMYDDVSTPLNFSIADIRQPEKRNSNYSKTIKIPGTKGNNLLFGNIFNVNISNGSFNPNSKVKAIMLIDDEEQINGYLQMLNISNDDNKIEYEVSILGNVGNIFNALGNSLLTDLDFSVYNHTYNYATQIASWTNGYGQGYVYPLIDYGFDDDKNHFNVEHLFPAIFLRTYIDKIFAGVGYTFTSTFFESTLFKKLIIPANASKILLTAAQVALKEFTATETVASTGSISGVFIDVIYDNEVNDPNNQYNPATGEWTVATSGYYNIEANGSVTITLSGTPQFNSVERMTIQRKPIGGSYNPIGDTNITGYLGSGVTTRATYVNATNVFLTAGDKVKIQSNFAVSGVSFTFSINGGTFKGSVVNSGLVEGDSLDMNSCIPIKIKQKDLLLSAIKMFNLYIDTDKNNDKNLLIETRDTFYDDGENTDWTSKLDHSRPLEYRPMGDLDYKEFIYTYTEDSDYYNNQYKKKYEEVYGRHRYITENEFLSNIGETKIIFSPTPLVGDVGNDRIIPRIWATESPNEAKDFNIRILYLGGTKTGSISYFYNGRTSGAHTLTQYLYAGHLDDTATPTIDINFGIPRELYYNRPLAATSWTDNNLFNVYHKKQIDEITDADSKIVTAYFYLRPSDIRTLDFRDQFYFEGQYFRLNKIYDYDPLKHEVTKCEFIKIKNAGTFTPTLYTLEDAIDNDLGLPILVGSNYDIRNNISFRNSSSSLIAGKRNIFNNNLKYAIIQGDGNVVGDSENVTLLGSSGNIIGSGCKNITLINSSGCIISSGLKNVSLQNTFDLTVTSGDIAYTNSTISSSNTFVKTRIPTASVLNLFSSPYLLVAAPPPGYYILVVEACCKVIYNSAPYATYTSLEFKTDTADISQYLILTVLNANTTKIITGRYDASAPNNTTTQLISGKALYLTTTTGNPTAGNSDLDIYLTYKIVEE